MQKETREVTIWKTSKNQTKLDHESTLAFLALRKQLDGQFNDRKTSKSALWHKIADRMNEMGYYVGDGIQGREKCRLKFTNLQSSAMKAIDRRRNTGEGKVADPPYFNEIMEIIGDKHKVSPVFVIDTLKNEKTTPTDSCSSSSYGLPDCSLVSDNATGSSSSVSDNTSSSASNDASCTSSISSATPSSMKKKAESNRFSDISTSIRPKKSKACLAETLKLISEENQKTRKAEFESVMNFMEQQSQQRHAEIMALISSQKRSGKKKKVESDSD